VQGGGDSWLFKRGAFSQAAKTRHMGRRKGRGGGKGWRKRRNVKSFGGFGKKKSVTDNDAEK